MFSILRNLSLAEARQIFLSCIVWPIWPSDWILGRHACLGRDVIKMSYIKTPVFNNQKGRVDFWLSCFKQSSLRTRTVELAPFLRRKDMIPILRQQEYCNKLPKHPPRFVYMDSLSELVDQLFINKKDGWGGCCYYSDINHSKQFEDNFEQKGLIDISQLESSYRNFFDQIREQYGEVPIVFLHFPSVLERRDKFLGRGQVILSVIEKLAQEYKNLYSIAIDENIVTSPIDVAPEMKDFPYHYNKETYVEFTKVLIDTLAEIEANSK
jgi:hypothetical protein